MIIVANWPHPHSGIMAVARSLNVSSRLVATSLRGDRRQRDLVAAVLVGGVMQLTERRQIVV